MPPFWLLQVIYLPTLVASGLEASSRKTFWLKSGTISHFFWAFVDRQLLPFGDRWHFHECVLHSTSQNPKLFFVSFLDTRNYFLANPYQQNFSHITNVRVTSFMLDRNYQQWSNELSILSHNLFNKTRRLSCLLLLLIMSNVNHSIQLVREICASTPLYWFVIINNITSATTRRFSFRSLRNNCSIAPTFFHFLQHENR